MEKELTIGQVSQQSGLSRSTLLYYHRLGLLRPVNRSHGNYRLYTANDVERLNQVCLYRKMGIPLEEIKRLLDSRQDDTPAKRILQHRLAVLEEEIDLRQQQQQQILRLLKQLRIWKIAPSHEAMSRLRNVPIGKRKKGSVNKENAVVDKKRWVEIMAAAGFSDQEMWQWHQAFEKMEPQGHQEFLEVLGIEADEIAKIRKKSAT
jgi:DNA-binding transcriptional MerR regulator